jgi:hypothetical protein
MIWPTAQVLTAAVPLPAGYRYELLRRVDVLSLIETVKACYPGVSVGTASCFLREDFYAEKVRFGPADDHRDFFVVTFKRGDDWAGMLAVERDKDSQVLYGRVGTIPFEHRGAGLSKLFPQLIEAMGTSMGMGMVYGLATLKVPNMQVGFEKAGWRLIGIIPGFDRELVGPGEVKRVFEAIYVKVLVTESELVQPSAEGLTPGTIALFELLFPGQLDRAGPTRPHGDHQLRPTNASSGRRGAGSIGGA